MRGHRMTRRSSKLANLTCLCIPGLALTQRLDTSCLGEEKMVPFLFDLPEAGIRLFE
jgi:hypothetical protein